MKIKLSISPCPNDTFMFDALVNGRIDSRGLDFELSFDDIERLNTSILQGEAQVSKISCAILPQVWERYAMLRAGAAMGRGNGPLLVVREGADVERLLALRGGDCAGGGSAIGGVGVGVDRAVSGRAGAGVGVDAGGSVCGDAGRSPRVAVPGEHTTANLLISKLFPHVADKPCYLFSDIADAVARGECDAGVLIHEGRFTFREKGLALAADLGAEWEHATGLPLALGAIVVSRELPQEVQRTVEELVRESVTYAFSHQNASSEFVKCHARELSESVTRSHIDMFVNDFSLDVGPDGERAVRELTGLRDEKLFVARGK